MARAERAETTIWTRRGWHNFPHQNVDVRYTSRSRRRLGRSRWPGRRCEISPGGTP